MLIDTQLTFSLGQAALTGTVVSTNVYDTGAAADIGIGEELYAYARVATAFAGGTSLQAVLQTSDDNSTFTTVQSGPVVALAGLTVGATLAKFRLPTGLKRYIRFAYVAVGTHTAGNVDAFILSGVDAQQYLPSGV